MYITSVFLTGFILKIVKRVKVWDSEVCHTWTPSLWNVLNYPTWTAWHAKKWERYSQSTGFHPKTSSIPIYAKSSLPNSQNAQDLAPEVCQVHCHWIMHTCSKWHTPFLKDFIPTSNCKAFLSVFITVHTKFLLSSCFSGLGFFSLLFFWYFWPGYCFTV